MSLRLRLSLLPLLIAGCAAQRLEVPDSDWETVPAPQRAAVDRQLAADLSAAQTELTAASTSLAELQRSLPKAASASPAPAPAPPLAPGAVKPAPTGDEWAAALHDHEHARGDAFVRVEAAKTAWQHADLSWRELRLAAASARLAMVVNQRDLVRAQTIDHNLPGTDHYDVAPLRGQFSQAQQRWYTAADSARKARSTLERASATLASAKEAYAQLMRNIPLSSSIPPVIASDERPPPLQLTSWTVTRADIRRRRGLRHFLDDAASAPAQLRKVALRLRVRAVPAAPTAAAVSTTGAPAAEVHGNAAVPAATAGMHPADAAAAGVSTGPSSPDIRKPAGHPGSSSAPATSISNNGKPAPGAPQASPPTAAANGKPAPGAPQATPPAAANPAAKPTNQPDAPTSAAAGASGTGKAAGAPQENAPAAASSAAAKPTNQPGSQASPASGLSTSGKSAAATPRSNSPGAGSTPAAKPVN